MPALLFDENLSRRLAQRLQSEYLGSLHVEDLVDRGATDEHIWREAADRALIIVSKDDDFRQRALIHGPPPKIIWLTIGNAPTDAVAELLLRHRAVIQAFADERETALLILA